MDKELDETTRVKLIEGCGRGCYNRFKFKKDIAQKGKCDIDKLIESYSQYFVICMEGEFVHVRYGKVSKQCYCLQGKFVPHNQTIYIVIAHVLLIKLSSKQPCHPVKVDILETLRKGGKTCHFQIKYLENN